MKDGEFTSEVRWQVDDRAGGRCEVCGEDPIAEYHHRRPRGQGGSKASDTGRASNCLGVCRECHRMIEKWRRVAKLAGWLLNQGSSPVERRVLYRGVWAILTDDGQVLQSCT